MYTLMSLYLYSFMIQPPPTSTLFPYTTLFRSLRRDRKHTARSRPRYHPPVPSDSSYHPVGSRAAHRGCHSRRCRDRDRKSTRLNSSHANSSYAVFCLKKKINTTFSYTTLRHP